MRICFYGCLLLVALGYLTACNDSLTDDGLMIDDTVQVSVTVRSGGTDPVAADYSLRNSAAGLAASEVFDRGFARPEHGASVMTYLARERQVSGSGDCIVVDEFFEELTPEGSGEVFVEFITRGTPGLGCQPEPGSVEGLIRPQSFDLGDDPGEVAIRVVGPFGAGGELITLTSTDRGRLIIESTDARSAIALGALGIYYTFRVEDAAFTDELTGTDYTVESMRGRLFAALPVF